MNKRNPLKAVGNALFLPAIFVQLYMMAQLPQARLDTVFPPGGQQGTELDVNLTGENLDGLRQLLFSHPGIQSDIKPEEPCSNASPPSFHVSISKDVPPGLYEMRTAGYFGVSNPRQFLVGANPEIFQQGTSHRVDQAMELPLNTVINGRVDPQAMNHFAIQLEAGRTYTIECASMSIDSKLNPALLLINPDGREKARSRSHGFIRYQARQNGRHIIRLHDALFQGGTPYFYRLQVNTNTGTEVRSSLPFDFRNKPGDAEIDISASLSNHSTTAEQEPNDNPEHVQLIQPTCDISGNFSSRHDIDRFEFNANKGDTWWVEVVSNRIGQPTSPFLLIERKETNAENQVILRTLKEVYAQTKNPLGRLLDLTHRDPNWRFEAPEDGTYQLRLADLFQHSETPDTVAYRLHIRKPEPDFTLVTLSSHATQINNDSRIIRPGETLLRSGMTWPLEVAVIRRNGFNGPIQLQATYLPEGVTSKTGQVPEGEDRGWLFLTAPTNAPTTWTNIRITGHATIGEKEVMHETKNATTIWTVEDYNNQPLEQRLTSAQWMATIGEETSPIIITPGVDTIRVNRGESVDIPLVVTWNGGAETGFKIKPVGFSSAEKLPELEIKPPETHYTYKLNTTDLKIPNGNYPLSWSGQTKIKYRNQPQVAEWYQAKLREADAKLAEAKSVAQSAEEKVTRAGSAPEQKQAIESHLAAARTALKEAESVQASIAQQAKEAEERAKPRDVDWLAYATPVMLELTSAQPAEERK